jgi:hypothetical protein
MTRPGIVESQASRPDLRGQRGKGVARDNFLPSRDQAGGRLAKRRVTYRRAADLMNSWLVARPDTWSRSFTILTPFPRALDDFSQEVYDVLRQSPPLKAPSSIA